MKKFRFHPNIKAIKNARRRTGFKFTKVAYAQMPKKSDNLDMKNLVQVLSIKLVAS